jgi:hypothetical protein
MRSLEVEQSIEFILEQLDNLPAPKPKDREKNLRLSDFPLCWLLAPRNL